MGAPFFQNVNAYVFNRKMSVWAAAEEGDLDGVKAAVENGADVEERGGWMEGTGLHYACYEGYFSIADYLIQRGAEVNCRNEYGSLPIPLPVKLLLNDFTSTDVTPLHLASWHGHTPLVDYLIQRGAEVNSRDKDGYLAYSLGLQWWSSRYCKITTQQGQ